ncbi:MAG: hypothetical protein FWD57_16750 [Polyangiaceae bacterium]|nr:hypothetical protein [Polyangiaceae bacterium]
MPLLVGVALHGVLDVVPHSHFISAIPDIIVALFVPMLVLPFVKRKYLILVLVCYGGSILPDVIDLGVFRFLGIGAFRIFPWHFAVVYNALNSVWTNRHVNVLFDLAALLICVALVLWKRRDAQRMLCDKPSIM